MHGSGIQERCKNTGHAWPAIGSEHRPLAGGEGERPESSLLSAAWLFDLNPRQPLMTTAPTTSQRDQTLWSQPLPTTPGDLRERAIYS